MRQREKQVTKKKLRRQKEKDHTMQKRLLDNLNQENLKILKQHKGKLLLAALLKNTACVTLYIFLFKQPCYYFFFRNSPHEPMSFENEMVAESSKNIYGGGRKHTVFRCVNC